VSLRTVCAALAAVVGGLLFAPVFGLPALAVPVGVPVAVVLVVALLCARRPGLRDWRPLITAPAGLLAVAEVSLWPTTANGLPTGRTLHALAAGVTDSWQLALQSTWPARPDPALLLFVPLLATAAAVLGIEVLDRVREPLAALLPSFAVVVISQLYAPLPPGRAAVAAAGYAAVAATMVARRDHRRFRPTLAQATPAIAGAVLIGLLVPAGPARYDPRAGRSAPLDRIGLTNPLDEIPERLATPTQVVFRVGPAAQVDRWPIAVLDDFDGVNWAPAEHFRRLGAEVRPGPAVTVPVTRHSADVDLVDTSSPWLPSQTWPASVTGLAPLVAEDQGTLVLPATPGATRYSLSWWQPRAGDLAGAAVDTRAPGGLDGVGIVPDNVQSLAEDAVHQMRPSFQAALVLENYLRANYRVAVGSSLPSGHGWPQLTEFLFSSKRGTSEQFAAAYVALARVIGIPARLAVGFRMPARPDADGRYTIRDGDVLAWPEVAVAGAGWVPLDPTGAAASAPPGGSGLAALAERARGQLPPPQDLRDPPVAPVPGDAPGGGHDDPSLRWLLVLVVPLAGWPVGVPSARALRSWRRRRRPGAAAVVGAWEDVRDRLRAYGVEATAAMTVRDLAAAAEPLTGPAAATEIRALASMVDGVLWSATAADPPVDQAWASARAVRRALARRGWRLRLRAIVDPRGLLPPR
jgi:hypothetical protein